MSKTGLNVTFYITSPESAENGTFEQSGWALPGGFLIGVDYVEPEDTYNMFPILSLDFDDFFDVENEIDWFVRTLYSKGAIIPSCSPSGEATSWSTDPETHNWSNGNDIAYTYHFYNVSSEVKHEVNKRMIKLMETCP